MLGRLVGMTVLTLALINGSFAAETVQVGGVSAVLLKPRGPPRASLILLAGQRREARCRGGGLNWPPWRQPACADTGPIRGPWFRSSGPRGRSERVVRSRIHGRGQATRRSRRHEPGNTACGARNCRRRASGRACVDCRFPLPAIGGARQRACDGYSRIAGLPSTNARGASSARWLSVHLACGR